MKKCCKILLKIIKWFFILVFAVVILFFIVRFIGRSINNKTPEGGINEQMYVDINGTKQWISIYGQDRDNPVLLYLHGGPGGATSHYDYAFTRKWSDVYTVVTWDQRNAGKSYSADQNNTELTYDMLMQDGIEMTNYLREHLGKEKISLIGHSWGSCYGCNLVLAHPEYYDYYIGVAQFVDSPKNEAAFVEAATKWVGDDPEGKALLEKLKTEPYAKVELMDKYGYAAYQDKWDFSEKIAMIFNPYYSLADYARIYDMDGSVYDRFYKGALNDFSLDGRTEYQVPYYNINGGCDYLCSFELAQEYFDQVNAPRKQLYLMEDTRHLVMGKSEELSRIVHEISEIEHKYSN